MEAVVQEGDDLPTVEMEAEEIPTSSTSKIDSFTWKMGVADDEVGDFRIPSKHKTEIEPPPSRDQTGDHLESPADAKDLEVTQDQDRPSYDVDAKPIPAGGDQEASGEPATTEGGAHEDHPRGEVALDGKGEAPALDGKGDDINPDVKFIDHEASVAHEHDSSGEVALDGKGEAPALDGKGDDIDPDVKFIDPEPFVQDGKISGPTPKGDEMDKVDVADPTFKVEIDPSAGELKIVKGEVESGVDVPTDAKDPAYIKDKLEGLESITGYENLEPILGRAVTDPAFRRLLMENPEAAVGSYGLNPEELELLGQIDPEQLDQLAGEVQARFADHSDESLTAAQGNLLIELIWGSEARDKLDADEGGVEHHDSWKGE
jgi:hypothetical protein